MGGRVVDKDRGFKRLKKQILGTRSGAGQAFAGLEVGVFGDIDPEAPSRMLINEFGVRPHVPARPALATTFDSQRGPIYLAFAKAYGRALLRRGSARDAGLEAAGQFLASRLRKNIVDWSSPANRPRTVRRKGFNDPLVETGTMAASVGYRVTGGPIRRDF
jgi:hypothetical protein